MPIFSRRNLFAGVGGLVATTAAAKAATAIEIYGGPEAVTYGPIKTLMISAAELHPRGGENPWVHVAPGGVAMGYGGQMFWAGVPVPVGTKLVKASLYLTPIGSATNFSVKRYNPDTNASLTVRTGTSTTGNGRETVNLNLNHVTLAGWMYTFDDMLISAGHAVLYGIRLQYQEPV